MKKVIFPKILISIILISILNISTAITAKEATLGNWVLQTGTALHKTDLNYQFLLGDYNHDGILDLYIIKKNGASSTTEVHVLNGKDNFQSFLLHTKTALHQTDSNFEFALGDYNRDGVLDLYAISKRGGSSTTEVHVLNGKDNFQSFLLHTKTALHQTDENFRFALGDYDSDGVLDLYAISKRGASSTTEVHVLSGKDNFQSFLLHTKTALHHTDSNFEFIPGNYIKSGVLGLYVIKKQGEKSTEVHVMKLRDLKPASIPSSAPSVVPKPPLAMVDRPVSAPKDYFDDIFGVFFRSLYVDGILERETPDLDKLAYYFKCFNHNAKYDIKRSERWESLFPKLPFPGAESTFLFRGKNITPEGLGNILYGMAGRLLNFSDRTIYQGGGYAAITASKEKDFGKLNDISQFYGDSEEDHYHIEMGINLLPSPDNPVDINLACIPKELLNLAEHILK